MGRKRTLNYRELRSYDEEGGEERKKDEDEFEEEEDEDEDEEEAVESESEDEESEEEGEGDEDEEAPKPVKKKKAPAPKPAKPKRTRASKVVRMRVVWGVFNNSNARVQTFPYPQRKEADEFAARMMAEKNSTFFVQLVKEPIEEKKE